MTIVDVDEGAVGDRFGSFKPPIICVDVGDAAGDVDNDRLGRPLFSTFSGASTRAPHCRQNLSLASTAAAQRQHGGRACGVVPGKGAPGGSGDIVGDGVVIGSANAVGASAMLARSTFFIAKAVDNGCPVGGVIHDGGAAVTGPLPVLAAPTIGMAATGGATGTGDDGSYAGSASRTEPQLTHTEVPGSL